MGPGLCLVELKAGSPDDYLLAILNKEMEHFFEREELWLILVDGEENDPERSLHLGVFIELVGYDIFPLSFAIPLNDRPGTKLNHALSGFISLTDSLFPINETPCRKIR